MFRMLVLVLSAVAVASPAWAGFIANRGQWNSLGQAQKAAYVMGLFDARAQVASGNDVHQAVMDARQQCIVDAGMNSDDLVTLIDDGYAADASVWTYPPVAIMLQQTNKVCRVQLNEALIAAGQQPTF